MEALKGSRRNSQSVTLITYDFGPVYTRPEWPVYLHNISIIQCNSKQNQLPFANVNGPFNRFLCGVCNKKTKFSKIFVVCNKKKAPQEQNKCMRFEYASR